MTFFKAIEKDEINFLGEGLNIRNDCQTGTWKMNTSPLTKKPIEIVILETDTLEGNFYADAEPTLWKQIWFVAAPNEKEIPQNVVCYTVVKTESLSNFEQAMILAQVNYKSKFDFIVECSFESRSYSSPDGKNGQYYAVTFNVRERNDSEKAQIKILEKFMSKTPKFSNQELKQRFKSVAKEKAFLEESMPTKYITAHVRDGYYSAADPYFGEEDDELKVAAKGK